MHIPPPKYTLAGFPRFLLLRRGLLRLLLLWAKRLCGRILRCICRYFVFLFPKLAYYYPLLIFINII
nr:MAG TPA: hypothetical protein [Caudoviricetes sp.]